MRDTDEHDGRPDNHSQRQRQPYKGPTFIAIEAISVTGLLILGYMFATDPVHRNKAIWIFFAAYVLVGFVAALNLTRCSHNELDNESHPPLAPTPASTTTEQTNQSIGKVTQSGSQNIVAGRDVHVEAPRLEPPAFSEKVETYVFSFGGEGMIVAVPAKELENQPRTPFTFGTFHPIKVYIENGMFMVDVTWRLGAQGADVQLVGNKLSGRPQGWQKNSNKRALEILDETGRPVFQFIKEDESHILVKGVFSYPGGGVMIAMDRGFVARTDISSPYRDKITRIFKYPAWKCPGEYESPPSATATPMSNTNISSVNQSGGFTGINQGTVNLAPPARTISAADRAKFISYLRNSPKGRVEIWFDASDPESNAFAEQLMSLLNEAGYPATIGGGFMAAISPPLIGVVGCVGDTDHPPLYAAYVRAGLEHINIGTTGMAQANLGKDEFRIQVGPNPAKFKQP